MIVTARHAGMRQQLTAAEDLVSLAGCLEPQRMLLLNSIGLMRVPALEFENSD